MGCGGDTLSFDPVANAASKTVQSTSSRVAFTATMDIDGVGGMSFSGSGVFDGRARSGALNMRFAMPAQLQSALGGADPSMQMIMDGRDGLVMYMRSPLFKGMADKWIKVDMEKLAKKQGVDLSSLMNANQADPSQSLRMLMASTDAHPIGYDRVRGVFTTHYKLNIDLARLAKDNKELRKSFEQLRRAQRRLVVSRRGVDRRQGSCAPPEDRHVVQQPHGWGVPDDDDRGALRLRHQGRRAAARAGDVIDLASLGG